MSTREDVEVLTGPEVGGLFRVDPKTVERWGVDGLLLSVLAPGRKRRYFAAEVAALLRGDDPAKAREIGLAEQARLSGGAS